MNKKLYPALIMIASLFAASANGAPMAYSVNSDSGDGDILFYIDLDTGSSTPRPLPLFSGTFNSNDVEGLAFDSNGTLWGFDDGYLAEYPTMFPIDTSSGAGNPLNFISFNSLPSGGANDFGMTFTCDNSLYVTSVDTQTLYKLDLLGNTTAVGAPGTLNADISAIAAIGDPTRLYGLSNGDTGSPALYSINTDTGVATLIGPLGNYTYNEAGLAFDSNGDLWAITDRSAMNSQSSQIFSINVITGAATQVSTTLNEIGFESLAIAPPSGCARAPAPGNDYETIPTLSQAGRLLTILILLSAGMLFLRRRIS